ncbi:MAG TPA: hypothetical protein VHT03_09370 [Rhizomicrobium sp.]|jgi:hypothetical protein|nr:hypothetical protein [Rhizomicrobium sp.]
MIASNELKTSAGVLDGTEPANHDLSVHAGNSVIHIGLHKVASTTLQHSLHALRPDLAAQGFFYPGDDLPHPKQHSDLALFLHEAGEEKYRTAMDAILRDFRNLEGANLLLSGEEFSSLLPAQIEALHRDLAETGRQFRVVLYVRNLYRIAISAIAEHSKTGKFVAYPSRVIDRRRVNPSSILSHWEDVFGKENVIAACLEALPAETNIVSHFADLAGIKLPAEFRMIERNRSADPIASALLSHLAYEFQVSHHFFYRSYFENVRGRLALPRMEDHLLGTADKWVADVDLSHPKLVPFRDLLRSRPTASPPADASAESAVGYLRLLGKTLLRTAERIEQRDEQPKRSRRRKPPIEIGGPHRQRSTRR